MEVVLRESVLIPRGGGAGRDGPAVAFVNRGDAATWVLGCGCRDTGAGVGTDLVMAGLGACPDAETIGRGGVCTGKGLAFMLLKASLASLFALTLSVHLPPFFGTICLTIPDAGTAKLSLEVTISLRYFPPQILRYLRHHSIKNGDVSSVVEASVKTSSSS